MSVDTRHHLNKKTWEWILVICFQNDSQFEYTKKAFLYVSGCWAPWVGNINSHCAIVSQLASSQSLHSRLPFLYSHLNSLASFLRKHVLVAEPCWIQNVIQPIYERQLAFDCMGCSRTVVVRLIYSHGPRQQDFANNTLSSTSRISDFRLSCTINLLNTVSD